MSAIAETAPRTRTRPRPGRWKVFGISFAFIAALTTLWSLASPLMSIPDEPAHVVRAAAVVRGDFVGTPSEGNPTLMKVEVPRYIAQAAARTCFVWADPPRTPECFTGEAPGPDDIVAGETSAGPNNPLYYAVVGWPTLLLSNDIAFYAMRIVSGLVCAVLLGFMFMALSQLPARRWSMLAGAASVTPMVLFLSGGVNPNGFEIAGAAALFATLLVTFRLPSPAWLLWERAAIVVVSALLLVTARSVAFLWLALILAGAFALAERPVLAALRKRVATWVGLTLSAVACVIGLVWLAVPLHLAAGDPFPGGGQTFRLAVETMLTRTLYYGQAWIGAFGWTQTPAPALTNAIWASALAVLLVGAIALARGRYRLMVILWAVAVLILPPILQGAVVTDLGYIWQGRYNLAVVVCLLLAAGLALDDRFRRPISPDGARLVHWGLWGLAIAQLASFLWILKGYMVADRTWLETITDPSWSPPGGFLLLGFLFAAVLFTAVWTTRRYFVGEQSYFVGEQSPVGVTAHSAR
jgi:hypothetical protein